MNRSIFQAVALTAAVALGGVAWGDQEASSGSSGQSQAMPTEKCFVKEASCDNMAEVQLGQLAQQKAQSQEVKDLAQKIVQDHQKAEDKLKQVAMKIGVQLSDQLPPAKQEEMQAMSQLQGADFDKEYVSMMKAGHAKDISKFGDVAQMAKNEDVKQYAQEQLPHLKEHGQMVLQQASAQGLTGSLLDQAQTAGATINPGKDSQSSQQGSSTAGDTTGTGQRSR